MFKKALSLLLCVVMCMGIFTCMVVDASAVYNAKSIFAVTSTPVKDNLIKYTINITAEQKTVAGAVINVKFDSNVLKPINCAPAQTTTADSGTKQNFEGSYAYGVTQSNPNVYSIAYTNSVAAETGGKAVAFFNIAFEVISKEKPKTNVVFYCKEYYSTTEPEKNITISDGPQLINEYRNVATLEAPQPKGIAPVEGGFKVTWGAVTGAKGYAIYRSTPENARMNIGEVAGENNTSYIDTGLVSGVTYTYTITAINDYGESAFDSVGISAKHIAKPTVTSVKNVVGGVEIRWNKTEGAQFYNIMRRVEGETTWKKVGTREATLDSFFKDTGVVDGKTYEYDVVSATDTFESAVAQTGVKVIYINASSISSAVNVVNGIELKWPAHSKATSYVIYKKTVGIDKNMVEYATTTSNVYVDSNVEAGKAYTYSVKVCTNYGESAYNITGYTITCVPSTTVTNLLAGHSSLTIQWNAVKGVDGYVVYRKAVSSDSWTKLATVKNNIYSYEDKTLTSGAKYSYAVTPVLSNSEGAKVPSTAVYFIKAPSSVVATNEKGGVTVTWDKVTGAVSYDVYRREPGGVSTKLANVKDSSQTAYTDKAVSFDKTYIYTVVSNNPAGDSKHSVDSNTLLRLQAIGKATPVIDLGGIKVTWQTAPIADSYAVYRYNGTSWIFIAQVDENFYLDKDVNSNVLYSYAVAAVKSGSRGILNTDSPVKLRYIAPASGIKAINGANYTRVSWNAVEGATKYYLYKSDTLNGAYKLIATLDAKTRYFDDKSVSAGKECYYSVISTNGETTSTHSLTPRRSVFLTTPQITSVTNVYEGQRVAWKSVEGATGYRVYRKVYGAKYYTYITTVDAKTLAYTDNGGTNGAIMVYCVKAENQNSHSAYRARCMTYVTAPKLSISNSPNGIYMKWDKNNKAVNYNVYRKVVGAKYWTRIACVKTPYYTDTNVKSGINYLYTVKAYTGKILSGCNMNGWGILNLATPKITSVANGYGAVTCFWQKVPGATSYNVYRKADKETAWTYIGKTSNYFYRDADVKNLSTYTYTVRATNGKQISSFNYSGVSRKYLLAPSLKISNSTTGIYISWAKVTGASSYYLYRKAGNAKYWTKIDTITGTSYFDTKVTPGIVYTYTIRAYGSKTLSGCNSYGWRSMYLNTPTLKSALSYQNGIHVKWQSVPVATGYVVYRKAEGDKSWTQIGKTSGNKNTTFIDTKGTFGVTYTYTVRASYGNYRSWFQQGVSCDCNY